MAGNTILPNLNVTAIAVSTTGWNPWMNGNMSILDGLGGSVQSILSSSALDSVQISSGNTSGATTNITNGGITLVGGNNITLSQSLQVITISGAAPNPNVSMFTKDQLAEVNAIITSASASSGSTVFGSTMYMEEIFLPGNINLSEVDIAMSFALGTQTTTGLWGSMNRSMAIYSFGASTSLSSFLSASQGISFNGSSTTTGTATALSQVAGGWTATGGVIVPMTFASSSLLAGQYVIANLIAFSASTTVSASLFGVALGGFATSTLGAMSSGGLAAATAFTAAPTNATVLSNAGTALLTYVSNIASLAITNVEASSTFISSATSTYSAWEKMNAIARTVLTASTSASLTAFSAAPTAASVMSNAGTGAGSFIGTSGSMSALTSVTANVTAPAFVYLGASSAYAAGLNYAPFHFAVMNTGGIPASINLITGTANNLTTFGSTAALQPWWALIGV